MKRELFIVNAFGIFFIIATFFSRMLKSEKLVGAYSQYFIEYVSSRFIINESMMIVINIVLLFIFINLFFIITKEIFNEKISLISSIIIISSPVFMYNIVAITPMIIIAILFMINVYMLRRWQMSEKSIWIILFFIANIILSFISIIAFVINIGIIIYLLITKKNIYFLLLSIFAATGEYFLIKKDEVFSNLVDVKLLALFNADTGLTFIIIILSILGYVMEIYNGRKNLNNTLWAFAILLSLSTFYIEKTAIVVATIILSLSASLAIMHLQNQNWKLYYLKNITILLIVCIILFSTVSYTKDLSMQKPQNEDKNIQYFLSTVKESKNIYAEPKDQYIIVNKNQRVFLSEEQKKILIESRTKEKVQNILENNNINMIIIPNEPTSYWTEKINAGLLFVLNNNDNFAKIYTSNSYQIWQYN